MGKLPYRIYEEKQFRCTMNLWKKIVIWFRLRKKLREMKKQDPFIYK